MDEMGPVSCERPCLYQSRCDARLEHFAVPVSMCAANELGGIGATNDLRDSLFHALEGLPVAARCKRVAVLAVSLICSGIRCSRAHTLDQLRRDAIALNREGVIGITLINVVHEL